VNAFVQGQARDKEYGIMRIWPRRIIIPGTRFTFFMTATVAHRVPGLRAYTLAVGTDLAGYFEAQRRGAEGEATKWLAIFIVGTVATIAFGAAGGFSWIADELLTLGERGAIGRIGHIWTGRPVYNPGGGYSKFLAHVDEYYGGHWQLFGKGGRRYGSITTLEETLGQLPKSVRKNRAVQELIKKAIDFIARKFGGR